MNETQETNNRYELEMRVRPEPSAMPDVRRATQQICDEAGIAPEDCAALDLAIGEALANAIVHGKSHPQSNVHSEDAQDVHVSVWKHQSHLIIQVRDSGEGFIPPMPPYEMPAPETDAVHGRGLPLMQFLTDALILCRGDAHEGGSSTFLIKECASQVV